MGVGLGLELKPCSYNKTAICLGALNLSAPFDHIDFHNLAMFSLFATVFVSVFHWMIMLGASDRHRLALCWYSPHRPRLS